MKKVFISVNKLIKAIYSCISVPNVTIKATLCDKSEKSPYVIKWIENGEIS